MRRIFCLFFPLIVLFFPCRNLSAQESFPFKLASRPSVLEIQRFKGEGKTHLVYELYLENFHRKPLRIAALQIQLSLQGKDAFVKELRGEELKNSYSGISEDYLKPHEPVLAPGSAGIVFVFLDLPEKVGAVDGIQNHWVVEEEGNAASRQTLAGGNLKVSAKPAMIVSPPLKGNNWWTFNGPANNSIHRRVVVPFEGGIWEPERLASDWIKLDDQGKNFTGPADQNSSYHAYGAEIHAVADGKIVAMKDGIPENVPNSGRMAVPINLETIGGNHLLEDLGGGRYAFYAHLQPGKIRVKVGDTVKRGQVLALLGNSGNSTEPHLHFHVIDRPDPLMGQGQPYVFDRFTRVVSDIQLDKDDNIVSFKIKGREPVVNEAYMNLENVDF